jgi:arylsulfatase/arylsulfatase A
VAETKSSARPNLVLIVADDLGWGDLACHGNPAIATPNIDAMLARGGELTRFYVSPVCSPTRACLMTGRYNYRTRVTDTFKGHSMMETDERTIAELLHDAGYVTGIFGKWHLGDCYPLRPQDQGFDEAVICRGGGLGQSSDPIDTRGRYTNATLWQNGREFSSNGFCTDVFFGAATEFVERCVQTGKPFFVYLAPNAPHGPYDDVPDALYRKYKAADLSEVVAGNARQVDKTARIFAMIENIDENVGRLQACLSRLGIARNSLVIFMSDNGPDGARYVGNRRGQKGEVFEGGIISPFIVEWPGHVSAGLRNDRIAAHIDLLPTMLEIAGVAPPSDLRLDGRSLMPLLTESKSEWPERSLFIQGHRGGRPVAGHNVAVIQQRWKLVRSTGFGNLVPDDRVPYRLYDIPADPTESKDLSRQEPDVVSRLQAQYESWFADVSATRPDNYAPPRIVIATDAEPLTTLTRQDWQVSGPGGGEQGEWLIRALSPCVLDIEVIFEKRSIGEARLNLGPVFLTQVLDNPVRTIAFRDVALPAGDWGVQFELEQAKAKVAPYQIRVTKK